MGFSTLAEQVFVYAGFTVVNEFDFNTVIDEGGFESRFKEMRKAFLQKPLGFLLRAFQVTEQILRHLQKYSDVKIRTIAI